MGGTVPKLMKCGGWRKMRNYSKSPMFQRTIFLMSRILAVLLIPFFPLNTLNPSWWLLISPLSWLRLFPRWLSG